MKNKGNQEFRKNNILTIIVLAVIFGMAAGIVGDLIARVYLLDDTFNFPFYGEINFSNGSYQDSNIVIRGAKKVVVEQNNKVVETINSVRGSLVGIYKKNLLAESASEIKQFDLGNYYKLEYEVAQGLIITSDGWIISSYLPENLNYVIITQDKKIYSIDKIISDTITPFHFLHVPAKDFPVRRFAEQSDIKNGQLAVAINWGGEAMLNSISNSKKEEGGILSFTDSFDDKIELADGLLKEFWGSFLFNLSGEVVGLSSQSGAVEPISHFSGAIQSLLKKKEIIRPSLGINYIDLSKLVSAIPRSSGQGEYNNGALIYKSINGISIIKGGAGEKAGLKDGDIIISVEGVEINKYNNLTDIIQRYIAGDKVNIIYKRGGNEKEIEVVLGRAVK